MTNKEIAERLRDMSNRIGSLIQASLAELADELDPPRPEPGTVVWWRYLGDHKYDWYLGECEDYGIDQFGTNDIAKWSDIEYKPARIAGPMQEIVDIPPVSEWPDDVGSITQRMIPHRSRTSHTIITRTEAALREVEG